VQIFPKKQQSFSFAVDSKPLLVNFDYHGTLIKELDFEKPTEDLAYQLTRDDDVLGRVWALSELRKRSASPTVAEVEKQAITTELANAATRDKFWGVRVDAASALAGAKLNVAREALIAATQDTDARVRARAVASLAAYNDPSLAGLYLKLLDDPSYGVIKAASLALGATKSSQSYNALVRLLGIPSWRDNIRVSALNGLAELKDKRSLEYAFRYVEKGNLTQVRVGALNLLGKVGSDNTRAFAVVANLAKRSFEAGDSALATASGEALVALGDRKGLQILEELSRNQAVTERLKVRAAEYTKLLREAVAATPNSGTPHP
jgi:aminopeptidase N